MKQKLNIDFDNWNDIPIITNEQQIKELHPEFYNFLKKEKSLDIYLKIFDRCHWKNKGDTFEKIMNYYKSINKLNNFLLYPFYNTLNFDCIVKYDKYYYYFIKTLDFKFKYKKSKNLKRY
jgi:hypothetical protein